MAKNELSFDDLRDSMKEDDSKKRVFIIDKHFIITLFAILLVVGILFNIKG